MTLTQLWNLLLRLTGVTATIEGLTLGISRAIAGWDAVFKSIVKPITEIHHAVTDSAHGNAAIAAAISVFTNANTKTIADILSAIGGLPVPPTPPDVPSIVSGVWAELDPFSDDGALPYGQELANAHRWATFAITGGSLPAKHSPFFNVSYPPLAPDTIPSNWTWPQPDWAAILADDTLLTWLFRTCPDFTWSTDSSDENIIGYLTSLYEPEAPHFTPRLTQTEWARVYGARAAKAPIWPGIDGVTLGTTVPAVESTVLEIPMDGILWLTTSYPSARARWGAAPYYSVYHTGRLAFITDNGDLEPFQYMGWQNAVYVPQTMGRAAGVVVFLEANIEGAITPWDITM
jgi:hypothetical protein